MALTLLLTVALNVGLFMLVPKALFPQQDSGLLMGGITADQSISFQAMRAKLAQAQAIVKADPAVETVAGFTGGGIGSNSTNQAQVFVTLKPLEERGASVFRVMARLRAKLATIAGARLMMFPMQDLFTGGRMSFAQFQYTLQADSVDQLRIWVPKLEQAMKQSPALADVTSDLQIGGLETRVEIDRATAARFGLTPDIIDATLYDAFGQRQVSTIYKAQSQYHVVMELAPRYLEDPDSLKLIYVSGSGESASGTSSTNAVSGTVTSSSTTSSSGSTSATNQATNSIATSNNGTVSSGTAISTITETMVPLAAFAHLVPKAAPVQVNHQGQSAATTISFNLAPGRPLSDAMGAVEAAVRAIHLPGAIHGGFAGTAGASESTVSTMPLLIAAALLAIYAVLGILYESYVHPLTILSTIPSAGVGAVLALLLTHTEFSVIALIGVFLLIGIVKKNAIMMVDFALQSAREDNLSSEEAIYRACMVRFRPIMMTTAAALFGAVPLVLDSGMGAELRHPLGIAIIGGLIVSQMLTLYTTPVVYLYLDRLRRRPLRRSAPNSLAPGFSR